jgi:tripartite-type tricarboxylate transporter receptor subunit TctC
VRFIVAFTAGGTNDIIARLIGQGLSERLGQPVIIENRPDAGSNIGTEVVVRAPPDGYTLLMAGTPNAINATLYEKLSFDFIRDIAPAAGILRVPLVMEVHPSVPVYTVSEFIAHAKANASKINYASAGVGGVTHVSGELFKMLAGVEMRHVPYRGAGGTDRPAWRAGAGDVRHYAFVHRVHPGGQAARPGGDHRKAFGGVAGPADCGRLRAGL